MSAHPLAVLTFANPALLWGAAACAIPIAVHLFMRARPRRQAFPAMQLLVAVQAGSVREHRIRNLLLLLVRMLAIALLVAAIARPVSRGSWLAARSRGPTAAAFVIDDSASMAQRYAGKTRLTRGSEWATQLVNDSVRFPTGSSFAVVSSGHAPSPTRLIDSPSEALRALTSATDDGHDRALGSAIDRAASVLSASKSGRREMYIVTDNTRSAWADAAAGRWAAMTDTAVFILDAGDAEQENARLLNLQLPGAVVQPRSPIKISCTLEAGDRPLHTHVDAYLDGVVVARSDPVSIQPGESKQVAITMPSLTPGVHAGELRLAGPDANLIDDSLFFALEARTPSAVLVIAATEDPADETEAQRVAALLAPPTMAEDRRPFQVELKTGGAAGVDVRRSAAGSIIWIGVPDLTADQRAAYDQFVKDGGRLLALPPATLANSTNRLPLLPGHWDRIAALDQPLRLRWIERPATPRGPSTLPFDLSFTRREGADSLSERHVTRFAHITPESDAVRLADLENGLPAILARTTGSGAVVQFAFRLDPDWGDLGSRAAAAMVLFHAWVGNAGGPSSHAMQLHCGDTVQVDCGALPGSEVLLQADRGKRDEPTPEKRKVATGGRLAIRANSAGSILIRDPKDHRLLATCAVNLREGETKNDPTPPEQIRAAFASGAAVIISDPATLETPTAAVAGDREWDGYAFLALFALLAGEILFANRFYRSR